MGNIANQPAPSCGPFAVFVVWGLEPSSEVHTPRPYPQKVQAGQMTTAVSFRTTSMTPPVAAYRSPSLLAEVSAR